MRMGFFHYGMIFILFRFIGLFIKVCVVATAFMFLWPFGLMVLIARSRRNHHPKPRVEYPSIKASLLAAVAPEFAPQLLKTERSQAPSAEPELPRDLNDTMRGLQQMGLQKSRAERIAREVYAKLGPGAGLSAYMSAGLRQHGQT